MTTPAALLRAVCLDPGDVLARLAYADRLEDEGNDDLATMVRLARDHPTPRAPALWWPADTPTSAGRLPAGLPADAAFAWHCGLAWAVSMTTADFLRHAGALFAAQPITSVTLTDRGPPVGRSMPRRPEYRVAWYLDRRASRLAALADVAVARDLVPAKLFRLLRGGSAHGGARTYPDESDALAALSAACVARGRRAAGLPPLP